MCSGSATICKLCFTVTKTEDSLQILSDKGIEANVDSIIALHLSSQIKNSDTKFNIICLLCWQTLYNFHQLYEQVERNYQNLENEKLKKEQYFVAPTFVKQEISFEFCDKQNDISNYIEEEKITINKLPSKENTSNENLQTDVEESDEYVDKCSNYEETTSKRRRKKKKKRPFPKKHPKTNKAVSKKENATRNKFDSTKHLHKIPKYFHMYCEICAKPFDSFNSARKHYKSAHDTLGYLQCCEKKFYLLHRIAQHCMLHENPDAFKCDICSKKFLDATGLHEHKKAMHSSIKEYKCDLCSALFQHKYLIISHLKTKHMKKEFKCDDCGKEFVYESKLRTHVREVHVQGFAFICEICAKGFKMKKNYVAHYKSLHSSDRGLLKSQCETCGKWVSDIHSHKRRHAIQRHECQICNRVFTIKSDLRAHIRYVHIDIHHACSICDKVFKKKISLREHMTVHTGRTDLYKCTFCPRTFRAGSNMYGHRKRAHPELYKKMQCAKLNTDKSCEENG